jgi:hypothetical protein
LVASTDTPSVWRNLKEVTKRRIETSLFRDALLGRSMLETLEEPGESALAPTSISCLLTLRAVSLFFAVFPVLPLHGGLAGPIELSRFAGK